MEATTNPVKKDVRSRFYFFAQKCACRPDEETFRCRVPMPALVSKRHQQI